MRKIIPLGGEWQFAMPGQEDANVCLPHTWNGIDGQDGGNDYLRTQCVYTKKFDAPVIPVGGKCILRFFGVNSECRVLINGVPVISHEGGYSAFFADITEHIKSKNTLAVEVTNEPNDRVYPQKADFTFYGGIYRQVDMVVLPANHFAFGNHSSPALKITADVRGESGLLTVTASIKGGGEAKVTVFDGDKEVANGALGSVIEVPDVRLWNGRHDPHLYTVKAELTVGGEVVDEVVGNAGFRTFSVDPDKGFILNGKAYPLRGVSRHQDRPGLGNAIGFAEHEEDIKLILELGATTIRLAHYQHAQEFYDLCDKYGLIIWAEIPYISKHMPNGNSNACLQMLELINQNYNHPSIVCWGISNEITISKISENTVACHKRLHRICHEEDPTRPTVVACYMAICKGNKTAHVSDLVSYNLYFGWYLPFAELSGWKLDGFHKKYPKTPLGLSEYGAEGMPNLHSSRPRRMDNTEEYQCIYHEKMLKVINDRPYLWATHVWNMFDFAADARNQGGEPGMNHKGLVTFDRKLKKDAFYLYKAFWSDEKFVHITSKRYVNRTGKTAKVKVYSNLGEVELFNNGKSLGKKKANRIFEFAVDLERSNNLTAKSGDFVDSAVIIRVDKPDKSYVLRKGNSTGKSWEKVE